MPFPIRIIDHLLCLFGYCYWGKLPLFCRKRSYRIDMEKDILERGIWYNSDLDRNAVYKDDRIAIIDNIQGLKNGQEFLSDLVKVDALLLVFCVKGKASLCINGDTYMIHPNDLLVCVPNIVFERSMISIDFEMRGVVLSPEYMKNMVLFECSSWSFRSFVEKHPVLSLNEEEAKLFRQYYDLLYEKMTRAPRKHQKELFDALLEMFHYDFYDTMERFYNENPKTFSSSEVLFRNFLDLLNTPGNNCRKVAYYADKLHVSPKYLSAVCKEVSGQTAFDLVNQYVLKNVKYMLQWSPKSIKEIAMELDFPNLSFFGKYVKRYLGVSPKQYREQLSSEKSSDTEA
ncbi:putative uncharacterized protein [Bacteroides sp. CAG:443]|nr:putative uncharacterized protein [Bacteroides sp. CAG:443]